MLKQIAFFRVSRVPKQWTASGIFTVSPWSLANSWTNLWSNMVEEKAGSRSRIPRKNLKRMGMPAPWREFCGFRIGLPVRIKDGRPDSENSKPELVKAPTVLKVTSRNPGHSAAVGITGISTMVRWTAPPKVTVLFKLRCAILAVWVPGCADSGCPNSESHLAARTDRNHDHEDQRLGLYDGKLVPA